MEIYILVFDKGSYSDHVAYNLVASTDQTYLENLKDKILEDARVWAGKKLKDIPESAKSVKLGSSDLRSLVIDRDDYDSGFLSIESVDFHG